MTNGEIATNLTGETAVETDVSRILMSSLGRSRSCEDLDRFSADEAGLLSYHGYWTLHACLATFMPHLAVAERAGPSTRHLDIGAHRFGRRLRGILPAGGDASSLTTYAAGSRELRPRSRAAHCPSNRGAPPRVG
jgi:hypothetical protein